MELGRAGRVRRGSQRHTQPGQRIGGKRGHTAFFQAQVYGETPLFAASR